MESASSATSRIARALVSRSLLLAHLAFTIYVLYDAFAPTSANPDSKTTRTRDPSLWWLIPLLGAIAILVEGFLVAVLTEGREPTACFSPLFFIYVATTVACYWLLELDNVRKARLGKRLSYDFNKFRCVTTQSPEETILVFCRYLQ
jgi:hypothetical protein